MEAVVYRRYGGPEVLEHHAVPTPIPGEGQVLLRVVATSINAADYRFMRADPFLVRFANGLFTPKRQVLGVDVAGVVEAVGPGVTQRKVGDAVFGDTFRDGLGAFAERVCVSERAVVAMPQTLSFEQAAALPLAGITALQAVRERAQVKPGQAVLVQGAGGGVGTLLVQLAKAYGATVTAVCGPGSLELVRSLGADRVLDYTQEDFARADDLYDVIFGVNGYHSLADYRGHLKPSGTYVMVGGEGRQLFDALIFGSLRFRGDGKKLEVLSLDDSLRAKDLEELRALVDSGQLRPVVDRVFPFAELAEAMRYVERGHVRGKVVIRVGAA